MKNGMTLARGFEADDLKVLVTIDDDNAVATYTNSFRGHDYFHVRNIYRDKTGAWAPGKGLAIPASKGAELLKKLASV